MKFLNFCLIACLSCTIYSTRIEEEMARYIKSSAPIITLQQHHQSSASSSASPEISLQQYQALALEYKKVAAENEKLKNLMQAQKQATPVAPPSYEESQSNQ